jgi:hypothetical protein
MRVTVIAALAMLLAACANVSTPEPEPGARSGPGFGAGMHAGRVSGQ